MVRALTSHQWFDSRTQPYQLKHMWFEFVVGSLLAAMGFSLGIPVLLSPQKTNKFQFIPESEGHTSVSCKAVK